MTLMSARQKLQRRRPTLFKSLPVPDLGFNKAERLATLLGLALRVDAGHAKPATHSNMNPLARAAATASVSYRTPLAPTQLKKFIAAGEVTDRFAPHLHALMDDAPVSLLAAVADQLDNETGIGRESVWKNYRRVARQVKSRRDIWE